MTAEGGKKPTGIKRLEKKRGRLWGLLGRGEEGIVPLSPSAMISRLRHILMSSVKTTTSFIRNQLGEGTLSEMLDHQASEFASRRMKLSYGADQMAENIIRLNFQPLGLEAEYKGNRDEASITVKNCPLPDRFLHIPELLIMRGEQRGGLKGLIGSGDSLTARGEWPPKRPEVCSLCRVILPRVSEERGFTWTYGLTRDRPPQCFFTLKSGPESKAPF
jgi:hypothetical protein